MNVKNSFALKHDRTTREKTDAKKHAEKWAHHRTLPLTTHNAALGQG